MLTIAGIKVASPTELKIGRFDLTKSGRTASGKMVMDIIATKRRLDVSWKMIADSDLQGILDAIANNKPFFEVSFPGRAGTEAMIAYAGDINTSLWHRIDGIRYWSEVTIPLIEQ